jgi:hypothetical protein
MLHLAPNCSAAGSLRIALPGAEIYSGMDALSCGPAREIPGETLGAWFFERAAFWVKVHAWSESTEDRSTIAEALRRDADPNCAVWAGSTADDQLFLTWACAVAPLLGNSRIYWVDCSDPAPRWPFASVSIQDPVTGAFRTMGCSCSRLVAVGQSSGNLCAMMRAAFALQTQTSLERVLPLERCLARIPSRRTSGLICAQREKTWR